MNLTEITNLGDLFQNSLNSEPTKIALIDGETGVKVSFQELDAKISKIRSILNDEGVRKGDRIALFFPNELEFLYVLFATIRSGAVPVLINVELSPELCTYIVEDSGASIIISSSQKNVSDRAFDSAHLNQIKTLIFTDLLRIKSNVSIQNTDMYDLTKLMKKSKPIKGSVPVSPGDPALQPYTSGSTGKPKGVILSHGGSLWNVKTICEFHELSHLDRAIVSAPMYHSNALNGAIKPMLLVGGSTVILNGFNSSKMIESIENFKVTYLRGVPAMFKLIVEDKKSLSSHDISSIKWAVSGSSSLPGSLITSFEEISGASMGVAYGLTEGGPVVTLSPRHGDKRIGSSGIPLPGVKTIIIDPQTKKQLPANSIGELLVSSPGLGTYHNLPNQEKTSFETLRGHRFLHTKDLAYVDPSGFHYIVGRIDDMMIVGGENVYPAEVESLLLKHIKIKDVCVVSLPHSIKGEAPVALIVSDPVTEEEIKQFALLNGPAYSHPRRIISIPKMPLSGTGKIDRTKARKIALDHFPDPL